MLILLLIKPTLGFSFYSFNTVTTFDLAHPQAAPATVRCLQLRATPALSDQPTNHNN